MPSGVTAQGGSSKISLHNQITIQFIHRSLAYLLTLLIAAWYLRSAKLPQLATVRALALLVVLLQVFLGVLTVMNSEVKIPLGFALAHQFTGMALLMVMIWGRFVTPRPNHI